MLLSSRTNVRDLIYSRICVAGDPSLAGRVSACKRIPFRRRGTMSHEFPAPPFVQDDSGSFCCIVPCKFIWMIYQYSSMLFHVNILPIRVQDRMLLESLDPWLRQPVANLP